MVSKYYSFMTVFLLVVNGLNNNLIGQEKSKVFLGSRLISNYDFEVYQDNNFRTLHIAPLFSINYKHHNFFIGPQYSYIFQQTPVSDQIFENNSFGLNFGYRYYSKSLLQNTRLFGELNYSIFQIKVANYKHGSAQLTDNTQVYIENTGSLGLDYALLNQLHLSCGVGFGSYSGFFLIFENFTLTSHIGIEYDF